MVFVGLDGALCCIDAVVCRFHELPLAILLLEEGFDGLGTLVVGDVKGRFVSFISQFVEHRFKCFDDGLIFEIADWFCTNLVGVIVVCNKKVLHALERADRQCSCLVGIHRAGLFIGKRCKAKNVVSFVRFLWLTLFFGSPHRRCLSLACHCLSSGAEARAMASHLAFRCCWRRWEIFPDEVWIGEEGYAFQLVIHYCIGNLLDGQV